MRTFRAIDEGAVAPFGEGWGVRDRRAGRHGGGGVYCHLVDGCAPRKRENRPAADLRGAKSPRARLERIRTFSSEKF